MPSPFARHSISKPITLPFDPDHSIVMRKLTGGEVEAAERAHMLSLVNGKSARGWAGRLARIFAGAEPVTAEAVQALAADPLSGYDRLTVARAGLVSWTYDLPTTPHAIPATDPDAKPVLYDPVADLDDEALEFIAREVAKKTWPSRFQTVEQMEADRKNG